MVTITTTILEKNAKDLEKFCQETNSHLHYNQSFGNYRNISISLGGLNVDKFSKLKKTWDLKNENVWLYRFKKLSNLFNIFY